MALKNSCMGIFRFNDPYFDLFDSTIYPLIETHTGLVCHDARFYYDARTIKMDLIAHMIEESHLLIIEISENNPNIFLEFGIAYSLRKSMIILCNIENYSTVWNNNLPFDLQGRELLKYEDKVDLRVKLGRYIFDALYNTSPTVLSWKSRHPHNHINSNSEIRLFEKEEVWSDRAVYPSFTIRYHVEILKVLQGVNPDIRLFFSSESNADPKHNDKGYPRIVIIFPWELSEKTASEYECHIDYFKSLHDNHERLQQVAVGQPDIKNISEENPLRYDFFVTFCWPNPIVESSLFKNDKERLVVPLDSFRDRGYPLHLPQFMGFRSKNSYTIIKKILRK